jgi:hypothetical protein
MRFTLAFACTLAASSTASAQTPKVPTASNLQFQTSSSSAMTPLTPVATTGSSSLVGGADDCANAEMISGTGAFAVNTTTASTSTQQSGVCPNANRDVWFSWTAPMGGIATMSLCGATFTDTILAIYTGAGCPTGTNFLACDDNTCGLQTQVSFPVVSGNIYALQVGTFGLNQPFDGTFTLNVVQAPTPDTCFMPATITGAGPHSFDNSVATTGTERQSNASCQFSGQTAIANDVWYRWTAPLTATYSLNTCGQTSMDSKIAVYYGADCPPASPIACNDDACGLQTNVCFDTTAGHNYTIQLGNSVNGAPGSGTFTLVPATITGPCGHFDDGTSELSVGLPLGGAVGWFNAFGAGVPSTTVSVIRTAFGTPMFPGIAPPAGTPFQVAIWDDPSDTGTLTGATLVAGSVTSATVAAGAIDTNVFQAVQIPPTTVSGIFFVGVVMTHAAGQFPAALDRTPGGSPCDVSAGGSWAAGDTTGVFDMVNLAANNRPPQTTAGIGLPGNWLLRVNCGAGMAYCFGDGTGTPCPCGNNGAPRHGCANSIHPTGGLLAGDGTPWLANDTVVLRGSRMPNDAALYFQGTAQTAGGTGTLFGDGLRCAAGTMIRLGVKTNVGGVSSYPTAGDPPISVAGLIPAAGGTRTYQAWYRNAAAFCTPLGYNLTNGYQLVWFP